MAIDTNYIKEQRVKNIIEFEKLQKEKGNSSRKGTTYNDILPQEYEEIQDIPKIDFKYRSDSERRTPLKVWENLDQLLKVKKINLKYNIVSKEIEVNGKNRSLDELLVKLNTLTQINGLHISTDDMFRFVKHIAKNNSFSPIINYLNECKEVWDGKSRVNLLCNTITSESNQEFNNLLITKWLVNAVHIAFNEEDRNCEGLLVIQGKQGLGKTRWIRSLIPKQKWLKTGMTIDPSNKDSVMKATKYWIIELGEMDATLKKEQAVLKQFFTEQTDENRSPYARTFEKTSRLTCFYATVNDIEFLRDDTGNRRYWTIQAKSINVNHGINLEQLWGEVMHLYTSGKVTTYLSKEETEQLSRNNRNFEVKSNIEIKILDCYDWTIKDTSKWTKYNVSQISDHISEKVNGISKNLRKIMLTNSLIKFDSNGRTFLLPPQRNRW